MASSWGLSWHLTGSDRWGGAWGAGVIVPPATVFYQGDGLSRKKRRRRDRQRELFDAIEASVRAAVLGEAVVPVAPAPSLAIAPAPVEPDLDRLKEYARQDEILQARLAKLQQDLAAHAAAQREAELRDDEESWMLLT